MMDNSNFGKEIVGVLFPGIVKNDEKAIACIGGIRSLSNVYSNMNKRRLGLTYQPENPFVKKIFATSRRTAGVLIKVKVKKTKVGDEVKREVISTSVVGSVKTIFRFESLGDFQYMPVHRETDDSPLKCTLEQILPSGLDTISFIKEPAPLYLIPPNFTRFEKPIRYTYTEKRYIMDRALSPDCNEKESVHSKIRALRGSYAVPYMFSLTNQPPTEPSENCLKLKVFKDSINPLLKQEYETVKKLFNERPIWSLNLIKYQTKIRGSSLKVIMPCLGVYHKTGPWRTMWVLFGYDPRKHPKARMYQALDFRLRHGQGMRSLILCRDESISRSGEPGYFKRPSTVETAANEDVPESSVYFRPDTIPTQRHIYYQYCDVTIPEVQEILATPLPPGYLCHEKRGWLPAAADEAARDHMFKYVKRNLLNSTNVELVKLEQGVGSDTDESNSDDDTRTSEVDPTEEQIDDA